MSSEPILVGVLGGSGVYKMEILKNVEEIEMDTPFGKPSDKVTVATVHGMRIAFIPRHGRNHTFNPTEVPYQANIFALKTLGVKYLISVSAVGSLREDMIPGELVVVDQFIDQTKCRGQTSTFFGKGIVSHVPFGEPTCPKFNALAHKAISAALPDVKVHASGTSVTMEGPVFSSKAESKFHQKIGGDLIGMTSVTESKLAKEAEMAHCTVAMVTDFDAWKEGDHVDVSKVIATLTKNSANAQIYLGAVIEALSKDQFESAAHGAMNGAIMTKPEAISVEQKKALAPLISKYFK